MSTSVVLSTVPGGALMVPGGALMLFEEGPLLEPEGVSEEWLVSALSEGSLSGVTKASSSSSSEAECRLGEGGMGLSKDRYQPLKCHIAKKVLTSAERTANKNYWPTVLNKHKEDKCVGEYDMGEAIMYAASKRGFWISPDEVNSTYCCFTYVLLLQVDSAYCCFTVSRTTAAVTTVRQMSRRHRHLLDDKQVDKGYDSTAKRPFPIEAMHSERVHVAERNDYMDDAKFMSLGDALELRDEMRGKSAEVLLAGAKGGPRGPEIIARPRSPHGHTVSWAELLNLLAGRGAPSSSSTGNDEASDLTRQISTARAPNPVQTVSRGEDDADDLVETTWKSLPPITRKFSECRMWAEVNELMRNDVAIRICAALHLISKPAPARPPAGSTAGTADFQAFYQAQLDSIVVDISGIKHLCSLFRQVNHRLGPLFEDHLITSCTDRYRLGKMNNFPRGWEQLRTPALEVEDTNWDLPEQDQSAILHE
ncbi:hypothetical protein B484DRAFT_397026 [Ochromonadaceae sp. CCMP2298]|nr:hypothetical protein B484DRAFT_397026 [Ochromonadaceae sp. CCMP2298]